MGRVLGALGLLFSACTVDNEVLPGVELACETSSQCPDRQVCTDAGRCLAAEDASLTLIGVEPIASNTLRVSFAEPLAGSPTRANFSIVATAGETALIVNGAEISSTDPRNAIVFTNFQIPGANYSLRIFGLIGVDGEETPDAGLSSLFTGYVEPATPRSLVLFAPAVVRQGELFQVSVLARNNVDLSAYGDMSSELEWSLSSAGEVEVVSAPGWDQGSQTFTLRAVSDPPIPDGETLNVTLSATALDDSSIDGTSPVFRLVGAVALARFDLVVPPVVQVDKEFEITIQAVGSDGQSLDDFLGSVSIRTSSGIGVLTPDRSPFFSDGVATVSLRYDALTPDLRIVVSDSNDPSKQGRSDPIEVSLTSFGSAGPTFTAIPTGAETIRLDWTTVPRATRYEIRWAEDEQPFEDLVTLVSGLFSYTHEFPGTAPRRYRLNAWDGETLLAIADAETATASLTPIVATVFDRPTVLDVESSPYLVRNPSGGRVTVTSSFTIEAGVVVLFADNGGLDFVGPQAALSIDGSAENPVHLSAQDILAPWDGLRLRADMQGTTFAPSSQEYLSGSRISHAIIDYASGRDHALGVSVPLDLNGLLLRHNAPSVAALSVTAPPASQITVRNSRFIQNIGSSFSMGADSVIWLTNTAWLFNSAANEGGAWQVNAVSDLARAVDRGSLYYQNTSGLDGGAIAGLGIAILDVTDSNFTLNRTQRRGGAVVGYSVASVARCAFARNSATSRVSPTEGLGGAVYLANGTIESSVFSGNRGQSGGAVATEGSIEVSDCVFENNIADEEGGAVSRRVAVERSTFRNNTAEESGGAAVLTADFFRNNLCDNNAGRQGGCLFMPQSSASVQVSTNTMTRNVGAFGGANVYVPITNCRTIDILRSYFGGGDTGVENDCPSADQSLTVETVDSPWPLCRDMPTQPDCVGSTLDP